ncbi:6-aminohexanoate-dimer hydrolase [Gammaproteobacteria bacterium]|nr:6-aminohexanoate-dimer hydrolase [Gammaproteobacteria bacterium]
MLIREIFPTCLLLLTACSPIAVAPTPTLSASPTITTPATPAPTVAPPTPLEPSPAPTAFPLARTDCQQRYSTIPTERDYWPTTEWRISTPAEHCLDPQKIERAAWYFENNYATRSLLIIRHGDLVYEKYFRSILKPNRTANIYSVTKSVLSALVGIAVDQGTLDSLDHAVIEYFPEYFYPQTDPRMKQVTLRHLLTMSAGFLWGEDGPIEARWQASDNWVEAAINLKFIDQPGAAFNYSSANTQLLSAILTRATGESLRTYAQRNLFTPLGITADRWHWGVDEQGYAVGGFAMNLRPRDMARFGYLYLNQGYWDGQQIISREWVQQSTSAQIHTGMGPDYGYLWWVHPRSDQPTFEALGYGGQSIYIAPALDLVVVVTSEVSPGGSGAPDPAPIITEWIIKAVTDQ